MPNFRGNEDLCKLGEEFLNDLLCKFGSFCLQHSKTFDIWLAFLRVTIAQLSTLKQVRFFMAHPVLFKINYYILTFTHKTDDNSACRLCRPTVDENWKAEPVEKWLTLAEKKSWSQDCPADFLSPTTLRNSANIWLMARIWSRRMIGAGNQVSHSWKYYLTFCLLGYEKYYFCLSNYQQSEC